jgi:hypothetical protein
MLNSNPKKMFLFNNYYLRIAKIKKFTINIIVMYITHF